MAASPRLLCAIAAFWTCVHAPRLAHAYSAPEAYAEPPSAGGGGGRWFTGSPAEGLGCSVCHSAAPGQREFPLYVAGLPLQTGYSLAGKQQIVLSWPEFATRWKELRPDPTVSPAPNTPSPSVGLVAELVAESGKGAGTIEIDAATAGPAELCEMTRPNLKPRLGVKLYQVRSGLAPLLLKPDSSGIVRCDAHQLGQRCIVALSSCGAHEVRFTWTAPATWQGPIWFSAGFVASEALSGTFERDSVQEVSLPVVQAGTAGGTYQQALHSGCALARASSQPRTAMPAFALAALAVLLGRRGRRRARRRS